jgi:hypothetical protein
MSFFWPSQLLNSELFFIHHSNIPFKKPNDNDNPQMDSNSTQELVVFGSLDKGNGIDV